MPTHPTHAQDRRPLRERTSAGDRAALATALVFGALAPCDAGDTLPTPTGPSARVADEDRELLSILAAMRLLGVTQRELARRLGLPKSSLHMRLNGLTPTTEVERYLYCAALFHDREEVAEIRERLAGHATLDGVDLGLLAPTAGGTS